MAFFQDWFTQTSEAKGNYKANIVAQSKDGPIIFEGALPIKRDQSFRRKIEFKFLADFVIEPRKETNQ